ncbi:MAG TPA: hypothetical protein VGO62_14165, partial [Myxococcota bacterium]
DELALYEHLDSALYAAAQHGHRSAALQDPQTTRESVAAAAAAGLRCATDDVSCLSKLAVLDDVDRVLVPSVVRAGKTVHARVLAVDAGGASALVAGDIALEPDDAERAAARALIESALAAPLTTRPQPSAPAALAPVVRTVDDAAPVAQPKPAPLTGLLLASAGAGLVTAGGTTAIAIDLALAKPELWADRAGKTFVGLLGLTAAAVGAAALAGGVAVIAVE